MRAPIGAGSSLSGTKEGPLCQTLGVACVALASEGIAIRRRGQTWSGDELQRASFGTSLVHRWYISGTSLVHLWYIADSMAVTWSRIGRCVALVAGGREFGLGDARVLERELVVLVGFGVVVAVEHVVVAKADVRVGCERVEG
eukprot:5217235-Pleurochrysis_carterae.AAC.1